MADAQDVAFVGDQDFQKEVVESAQPVVVTFWAPWSDPSVVFGPAVAAAARRHRDHVKAVAVNVDENRATTKQYGIAALPTLLRFEKGAVVGQIVGTTGDDELDALFRPRG